MVANWQHVLCYESVTYTTHGDYTFLDNMVPLIERWRAPISIALYAPGEDFANTVDSIFYLRNCLDNQRHMDLVRQFVSFHIYFNNSDMPPVDTVSDLVGLAERVVGGYYGGEMGIWSLKRGWRGDLLCGNGYV